MNSYGNEVSSVRKKLTGMSDRRDDVIFVGTCNFADVKLVDLLLNLGKHPLGFGGEFNPVFYLESDCWDKLPCGITMYDRGPVVNEAAHKNVLASAKMVIVAGDGPIEHTGLVGKLKQMVELGALPLVEYHLLAATPFAEFCPQISFSNPSELINAVYFYLANSAVISDVLQSLSTRIIHGVVSTTSSNFPMRILYLAFVESSYPQLFAKIDQQLRSMRRFNPDTHCYVIGPNDHNLTFDGYELKHIDANARRDLPNSRQAHFTLANEVVEMIHPDIIYFRYPFFDGPALDFVQKHRNIVFEIQSIAANEVTPEAAAVELLCGPHILERTLGLVAVTPELLNYDQNRSPRPLPGYVMSNGIDPESLSMLSPSYRDNEIHLLCAAHFSPWHGMDRIIEGFARYRFTEKVILHMAGGGEELNSYKDLCKAYGLEGQIVFHGMLNKVELEALSKICQVGIGSLGLHRLGLSQFCILKNREYCLRGMPFIYAGQDVDFNPSLPFVRVFPADDTPIDLGPVIELAHSVMNNPSLRHLARSYAFENLAWDKKIEGLVKFLHLVYEGKITEMTSDTLVNGKKRILLACTHFWPSIGGVEAIVADLGSHLAAKGNLVHVATLSHPERTSDAYRGVTILSLKQGRTSDNRAEWPLHLRSLLESGDYDACILISNPTTPLIWAADSTRIPKKTRIIIQPVINVDDYNGWKSDPAFVQQLSNLLKRNTTVALTLHGVDQQFFSQEGIKAQYVPNAVDIVSTANGFRKQFGIPDDVFVVVHVANLYKVKNHLGLINALKSLPGNVLLVLIGHPVGEYEYVEDVLRTLKKYPHILYIPGLAPDGVRQAINESNLVVLASHGEVSPVAILEAMSLRKPWLATLECGTANEMAGGLVLPLDRFPDVVTYLNNNRERASELGMLGYLNWKSCFTWHQVVDGWEDLIACGTLTHSFEMPAHIGHRMTSLRELIQSQACAVHEKNSTGSLAQLSGVYDSDKNQHYLNCYEQFLNKLVGKDMCLFELGVFKGGSLLLWRDYFTKGRIVGLDANKIEVEDPTGRIRIYQGFQQDLDLLDRIGSECAPAGFDVIIDDASHLGNLSRISFVLLFENHLKPGGIYVIEDWGTGYWSDFPDGSPYIQGVQHQSGMVGFVKELVDACGASDIKKSALQGATPISLSVASVHVFPGLVFVVKTDSKR